MHRPAATIVIVVPLVPVLVHTLVVNEEKVTEFAEPPPVAETVKGASPNVLLPSAPKVMAWFALPIVKLRVTCGAAL